MDDRQRKDELHRFDNEDHTEEKYRAEEQQHDQRAHYFSYGPYRSQESLRHQYQEERSEQQTSSEQEAGKQETQDHFTSYISQNGNSGSAEITRPEPIPKVPQPVKTYADWSYQGKKKSSFRSMFAAFMAGVLVISGLMFAADKMNLFSGNEATNTADIPTQSVPQNNSDVPVDSSIRNVAMQEIVRPGNIAEIVKMASPAVVKIETFVNASNQRGSLFDDPFFRQFFGDYYQPRRDSSNNEDKVQAGMGSGFIFDKSGYILTNQHVIDGADEIYVRVQGYAEPFKAELLGSNFDLDLAALKIEADKEFPTLKLGNSDALEVGDWVVAIGNPYGFDHTVTVGVLSAKERPISIQDQRQQRNYEHLLQTDASINPGNSGGPLLNLNGEVIGINTAVSAQAQGIGFAIPTSTVVSVLDNLKNDIPIPKPFVGIYMRDLTKAGLEKLGLENGVVISAIVEGSPAEEAGIQPYDVIVEIDGEKIATAEALQQLIAKKNVGDKISLRIYRDGHMITTGLTVGDANKR